MEQTPQMKPIQPVDSSVIQPPVVGSQKRISKKIPVLIGLCLAGLAIVVLLGRGGLTKAGDEKPTNVAIAPNSANSVTITWSTGNPTIGQVMSSSALDTFVGTAAAKSTPDYTPEDGDPKTDHSVTLENLQPGTTYYFEIQIGDSIYDNAGVAWTFTTPTSDQALKITPGSTKPTSTITNPFSNSPTPIQHLVIPNPTTATTPVASCTYTSCTDIKTHFGQGCNTQDYIKCLKK